MKRAAKQILVSYAVGVGAMGLILGAFTFDAVFVHHADIAGALKLSHDGVVTTGRVTATNPGNHGEVDFVYRVNGKDYRGIGPRNGVDLDPNIQELTPGDAIRVAYSSSNPDIYCTCDPKTASVNGIRDLAIFLLVGGAMIAAFLIFTTEVVLRRLGPFELRLGHRRWRLERNR